MKINDFFKKASFLIFIVTLLTSSAWAQPYSQVYVDVTNGSDTYTGEHSINNPAGSGPKATINAGLSNLANSGTLWIAAGTYNGADGSGSDVNINTTAYPNLTTGLTIHLYTLLDDIIRLTAGNVIYNVNGGTLNIVGYSSGGAYLLQTGGSITLGSSAPHSSTINLDAALSWTFAVATETINIFNASSFTTAAPTMNTNIVLNYSGDGTFTAGKEGQLSNYGSAGSITISKTAGTTLTFPSAISTVGGGITQTTGNTIFSAAVTTLGSFLQSAGTSQFVSTLSARDVTLSGTSASFGSNVTITGATTGFSNNTANVDITGNLVFSANSSLTNAASGTLTITGGITTFSTNTSPVNIANAGSLTVNGAVTLNYNSIVNSGTGSALFGGAITAKIGNNNTLGYIPQIINSSINNITFSQPLTYNVDILTADRDFTSTPLYLIENQNGGSILISSTVTLNNYVYTGTNQGWGVIAPVRNNGAGTLTIGQITATKTGTGTNANKFVTLNITNATSPGTLNLAGTASGSQIGLVSNVLGGTLNITGAISLTGNFTNGGTATTQGLTVAGTFANTDTCGIGASTVTGAATNSGPLTINGTSAFSSTFGNTNIVTAYASFSIADILTNTGTINLAGNTLTLSGNIAHATNGGTINGTSGSVTISNSGSNSFNGGTFPALIKSGAGTTTFGTNNIILGSLTQNAGTITVADNILLTTGNYSEVISAIAFYLNGTATFKITGDFTRTDGAFNAAVGSTLLINGTTAQNINGGTLFQVGKLTFTNTGGIINVLNSIRASGNVLISANTNLNMATLNLIINGTTNTITNNGIYTVTSGSGGGVVVGGFTTVNGGVIGAASGATYVITGSSPYSYITIDVGVGNFADVNGTAVEWTGRLTLATGTLNVTGGDFSPVGSVASIYRFPQKSPGIFQVGGTFNAAGVQYDVTYLGALLANQPVASEIIQTPANVRSWTVATTGNFNNDLPASNLNFGGTLIIASGATVRQNNPNAFVLTGTGLTHTIAGSFVTASGALFSVTGATVTINGGNATYPSGASAIGNTSVASIGSCTFTGINNFAGTFTTLASSIVSLGMGTYSNLIAGWNQSIVGPVVLGGSSFTLTTPVYDSLGITQNTGVVSIGLLPNQLHMTFGDYVQNATSTFDPNQTGYLTFDNARNLKIVSPLPYLRANGVAVTLTAVGTISHNLDITGAGTITNGGFNLTVNNVSTVSGNIFTGTGTMILQGTILGSGNPTISNLNVNSTGSPALASTSTTARVFSVSNLFTMTAGSLDLGINSLALQGNFVRTTTTGVITATSGELQFVGTGAQTVNQNTGFTVPNLTIINASGVTFDGSLVAPTNEFYVTSNLRLTNGVLNTQNDLVMHLATGVTITRVADLSSLNKLPVFDGTINLVYNPITTSPSVMAKEVPSAASLKVVNTTINVGSGKTLNTAAPFQYASAGTLLLVSGTFTASSPSNIITLTGGETIQLNSGVLSVIPTVAAGTIYNLIYNIGAPYTTGNEYVAGTKPNVTIQASTPLVLGISENANNVTLTSGSLDLNGNVFSVYANLNVAGGNFTNSSSTSGSLAFVGSTLQTWTIPSGTLQFNVALTINNSLPGSVYLTGGNLYLYGFGGTNTASIVTFKNGLFTIASPYWVKLTQTYGNQGFVFDTTGVGQHISYFVGTVAKSVTAGGTLPDHGRFEFPVGYGVNYRLVALTFNTPVVNSNTFYISARDTNPTGSAGFPLTYDDVTVDATANFSWLIRTDLGMSPSQQFDIELTGKGFTGSYPPNITPPITNNVANLRLVTRLGDSVPTNPWVVQGGNYQNFEPTTGLPIIRVTNSTGNLVAGTGGQFAFGIKKPVTLYSISGKVFYGKDTTSAPVQNLKNVTVNLMQGSTVVATSAPTNATGAFTFGGLLNGSYTLTATTTNLWAASGVNATDALMAASVFNTGYSITPIQLKAGDVNGNGIVNNTDALGIVRKFASSAPFTIADWQFVTPAVTVNNANVANQNILVLEAGDINASLTVSSLPKIGFTVSHVEKGETQINPTSSFSVPVTLEQASELGAISLSFTYPKDLATFEGLTTSLENIVVNDNNGTVTIGWADLTGGKSPLVLKSNSTLLTLNFKPTANFKVNASFGVQLDASRSELAYKDGSVIHASLQTSSFKASVPKEFALVQNYPNPFNPSTTIQYSLKDQGSVKLEIYNSLGQLVNTLVNQVQDAGVYKVNFNASSLASGVYFYKIKVESNSGNFMQIHKMLLLK
jgi:hypothetical protein